MFSKTTKSILCVCLSLFTIICSFNSIIAANASSEDDTVIMPCFEIIDGYTCGLFISGIKSTSIARLSSDRSTSLKIKMEIQKKKSGKYETIKTWTSSKTGTAITMSESRNINVLCDYRLKVTFTAGSETKVDYAYPA